MIFTRVNFKKPTNSFISAIQHYCLALVKAPVENDIVDLDTLQLKLRAFIDEQKHFYPKCKVDLIETEVHSYMASQVFNLLQGDDKIIIGLCSRRSEYQRAFEDYDRFSRQEIEAINSLI